MIMVGINLELSLSEYFSNGKFLDPMAGFAEALSTEGPWAEAL